MWSRGGCTGDGGQGDGRMGGGGCGDAESGLRGPGTPAQRGRRAGQPSRAACQPVPLAGWGSTPKGSSVATWAVVWGLRGPFSEWEEGRNGPADARGGASRVVLSVGSELMCYPRSPKCCSGARENPGARIWVLAAQAPQAPRSTMCALGQAWRAHAWSWPSSQPFAPGAERQGEWGSGVHLAARIPQ